MAKPFDVATKHLIESSPADWLAYVGLPPAETEIIDADLSTLSAASDKVIRVYARQPWLFHLELQASFETDMALRFFLYSHLLHWRHQIPIRTFVVLLRPQADHASLTGETVIEGPDGSARMTFRYDVVRVWEKPVEEILAGGLATLPLAPLANIRPEELPAVIRRMDQRLQSEAAAGTAQDYWAATLLLMGLRYPRALARQLLQGVRNMRESSTYQAILEEGREEGLETGMQLGIQQGIQQGIEQGLQTGLNTGRAEEARKTIFALGARRFGAPSEQIRTALEATQDLARLETLVLRLLDVETWEELLTE